MRKVFCLCIIILLIGVLFVGCAPEEEEPAPEEVEPVPEEESIVLSAVGFLPQDNLMSRLFFELDENLQEMTDGQISIVWTGGPEAVPGWEQHDAVAAGVVDMAMVSGAYYKDQEPVMSGLNLTPFTPTEEREKGVFDFFAEKTANVGLHLVMRGDYQVNTYFWSVDKYDSPRDMEGESFRSDPRVDMVLRDLGLDPVTIDMTEVYPALERGVVVGGSHPTIIVTPMGLHEIYNYVYEPHFMGSATVIIMNPDTYQQIPDGLQEKFDEAVLKTEQEYLEQTFVEEYEEFMAPFLDEGGEIITWTGEDADWYIETAHSALWDEIMEEDPEAAEELMEMYGVDY